MFRRAIHDGECKNSSVMYRVCTGSIHTMLTGLRSIHVELCAVNAVSPCMRRIRLTVPFFGCMSGTIMRPMTLWHSPRSIVSDTGAKRPAFHVDAMSVLSRFLHAYGLSNPAILYRAPRRV